MKYIWMVVYALVWIFVLCDGIHSVIINIKDGEDFEFWFDDMTTFSAVWVLINLISITIISFVFWLYGIKEASI